MNESIDFTIGPTVTIATQFRLQGSIPGYFVAATSPRLSFALLDVDAF
jgi:hypothetical protein